MDDQPGNTPNNEIPNIDLTALRHGPEALDPRGIPEIKKVEVLEFDITPKSEAHHLTTIQGTDILRSTSTDNTIPKRGIVSRAVFLLHPVNSSKPLAFELQPPDTIKTSAADEARLVRSWLQKSPFIAHPHTLAIIPLCLALTLAPAFDDDNFDEDDIDTDRSGLACTPVGYCRPSTCSHSADLGEAALFGVPAKKLYADLTTDLHKALIGGQWAVTRVDRVNSANLGCGNNAVPASVVAL